MNKKALFGATLSDACQLDDWEMIVRKKTHNVPAGKILVVCDSCHSSAIFSREQMVKRIDIVEVLDFSPQQSLLLRYENNCTYCRRGINIKPTIEVIKSNLKLQIPILHV